MGDMCGKKNIDLRVVSAENGFLIYEQIPASQPISYSPSKVWVACDVTDLLRVIKELTKETK